jgi:hypothetical protein
MACKGSSASLHRISGDGRVRHGGTWRFEGPPLWRIDPGESVIAVQGRLWPMKPVGLVTLEGGWGVADPVWVQPESGCAWFRGELGWVEACSADRAVTQVDPSFGERTPCAVSDNTGRAVFTDGHRAAIVDLRTGHDLHQLRYPGAWRTGRSGHLDELAGAAARQGEGVVAMGSTTLLPGRALVAELVLPVDRAVGVLVWRAAGAGAVDVEVRERGAAEAEAEVRTTFDAWDGRPRRLGFRPEGAAYELRISTATGGSVAWAVTFRPGEDP